MLHIPRMSEELDARAYISRSAASVVLSDTEDTEYPRIWIQEYCRWKDVAAEELRWPFLVRTSGDGPAYDSYLQKYIYEGSPIQPWVRRVPAKMSELQMLQLIAELVDDAEAWGIGQRQQRYGSKKKQCAIH